MNSAWKTRTATAIGRQHSPGNRQAPRRQNESILLTAGSGEALDVIGTTFLQNGKKGSASSRPTARLPARDHINRRHQAGRSARTIAKDIRR